MLISKQKITCGYTNFVAIIAEPKTYLQKREVYYVG